eukprot:1150323-Pelagomonas_calceolata.AAC.3
MGIENEHTRSCKQKELHLPTGVLRAASNNKLSAWHRQKSAAEVSQEPQLKCHPPRILTSEALHKKLWKQVLQTMLMAAAFILDWEPLASAAACKDGRVQ